MTWLPTTVRGGGQQQYRNIHGVGTRQPSRKKDRDGRADRQTERPPETTRRLPRLFLFYPTTLLPPPQSIPNCPAMPCPTSVKHTMVDWGVSPCKRVDTAHALQSLGAVAHPQSRAANWCCCARFPALRRSQDSWKMEAERKQTAKNRPARDDARSETSARHAMPIADTCTAPLDRWPCACCSRRRLRALCVHPFVGCSLSFVPGKESIPPTNERAPRPCRRSPPSPLGQQTW